MESDSTEIQQNWHPLLWSDVPQQQAWALQQVANHRPPRVDTARCVWLAGSSNDEVRMWAAEALESSVTPQGEEVAALVDLLTAASDGEHVYWAATMLGRLGATAASAVDALDQCLRDSLYLPARERAAWALRQIGAPAASAVPTLQRVAISGPPRLQRLATQACDLILSKSIHRRAA